MGMVICICVVVCVLSLYLRVCFRVFCVSCVQWQCAACSVQRVCSVQRQPGNMTKCAATNDKQKQSAYPSKTIEPTDIAIGHRHQKGDERAEACSVPSFWWRAVG